MRIAINPLQWRVPQSDELLGQLRQAGFDAVQTELEGRSAEEYRRLLDRHGLSPAPGYFEAPLSTFPLTLDVRSRARQFAVGHAELGLTEACLADVLHPDRGDAPPSRHCPLAAYGIVRIVQAIEEIASIWSAFGVTACVHNHVGSYIQTEDELDRVMRGTKAAFCPDTGHLAWAGIDPLEAVERYLTRVRVIHLKDLSAKVMAKASARGWDYERTVRAGLWQEPGHGDLDLLPIADLVREDAAWMVIEVDRSAATPFESALRCASWVHALA
jgi:inosose dehydratase